MSFKAKITFGFAVTIALMLIVIAYTLTNVISNRDHLKEIKGSDLPSALLSAQMSFDTVQIQQFLQDVSATHHDEGYEDAKSAYDDFKQSITQFRILYAASPEKLKLIDELDTKIDTFYAMGKTMAQKYVDEGIESGNVMMDEFDQIALDMTNNMAQLKTNETAKVLSNLETVYNESENSRIVMMIMSIVITIFSIVFCMILIRQLTAQIGGEPAEAAELASRIAEGHLDTQVTVKYPHPGNLMTSMKRMQEQLRERKLAEKVSHDEISRIKVALDGASTSLMITDNDLNIIYTNKAAIDLLREDETEIHRQLPNLNIDQLIGANIDAFHKDPSYQRQLLNGLTNKITANLILGKRHLKVIVCPVLNENGQRLGLVAEWRDYTSEVTAEKEVNAIVNAADAGDFTQRLNLEDKEGVLYNLGNGINKLLQTNEISLKEIAMVLEALSAGDLTQKITNEYQGTFGKLKNDTNTTVDKIRSIVYQIKTASDAINAGAQEISAGNNDLSRRTEEQAVSLDETSSRMRILTETVQDNAHNAKYANQLAENATLIAEQGSLVVNEVVDTMESINESSRKIVEIISVIDNIAFQTNILALNAAVEAARAGEQGRGFAVVATEVRNLAQRAANAAGEIKHLISDSVEKVEGGSRLVAKAGVTMSEIVNSIRGVTQSMTDITVASSEQSEGIKQVNHAIDKMDEVTQQNAALVEQAAASAEALEDQARSLSITVAHFKIA